jgi:phage-related minor tail protein
VARLRDLQKLPVMPAVVKTPGLEPTGGGGGGKTDDDSIDKQIARYKAMGAAADEASKKINAGYNQNIVDLLRQVKAQQTADDIVAKLEANHQVVSKEQKKALEDTVLATENKIAAEQKLIAVENQAAETQKKYGDGTVSLTKLHKDINDQLNTRRINETEAARATKEGTEAITQAALAAQRYDDNLGSLAAGFEHAANAYARQNDLYSQGEQVFGGLTTAMSDGLKALEGQSNKTFGQIATDFANMLADMALRAAVSQVFKTVFGAASGTGTGSGVVFSDVGDLISHLPGRASGGPVSGGQAYVVGESGPEMFIPAAAGNIVPNGAAGMTHNGDVVVNVAMSGNGNAADPRQTVEFARRIKAAVVDQISNEKRPGGVLYTRQSA